MPMRGRWHRLVACVGLAAFLAANALASTSAATHPGVAPRDGGVKQVPATLTAEGSAASCCHCGNDEGRVGKISAASQDHGCCPSGPCCPESPKRPFTPKCPCPGGCAYCNVAKVPCTTPAARFTSPASCCVWNNVPELASFYTPPSTGSLIRPPRV